MADIPARAFGQCVPEIIKCQVCLMQQAGRWSRSIELIVRPKIRVERDATILEELEAVLIFCLRAILQEVGEFEQSLARANVAAMLRPGGFLLSNDKLPDTVPSGLTDVLDTPVVISVEPLVRDVVFCYQREK